LREGNPGDRPDIEDSQCSDQLALRFRLQSEDRDFRTNVKTHTQQMADAAADVHIPVAGQCEFA